MNNLEDAMSTAGFTLSDTPPNLNETTNNVEQTQTSAPMEQEATSPSVGASEIPSESNNNDSNGGSLNTGENLGESFSTSERADGEAQINQAFAGERIDISSPNQQKEINTDSDFSETAALKFLNERFETEFTGFDEFSEMVSNRSVEIDESVVAINNFVRDTGRQPGDWYKYQSLDTSEMDDVTAVRNQMILEHPDLSRAEVDLLVNSKYKTDDGLYDETEISLGKLQLKMDATTARDKIEEVRELYKTPAPNQSSQAQSLINQEWISEMTSNVNDSNALSFNLPNGKEFNFGLNSDYKKGLISRNQNLDNYFEDYKDGNGNWHHDKLTAHRAVVDNIDSIVSSIYRQGLSDGQRKVVTDSANVSNSFSQVSNESGGNNSIADQLKAALGGNEGVTFNF